VTFLFAALMILASAAIIARPLLTPATLPVDSPANQATELLEREKNAALLAIREADFDRAMGKLSDEDYASLKGVYEQRALSAMNSLGKPEAPAAVGSVAAGKSDRALFCVRCGDPFGTADKFCAGCGSERPRLVRSS
jgi:hypothetical protein